MKIMVVGVNILLFGLIILGAFTWFKQAQTAGLDLSATTTQQTVPSTTDKKTAYDIQTLINAHLFGQAQPTATTAVKPVIINAPETQLNLILKGTLSTDNHYAAKAVIASSENSKGQEYPLGKTLPSGAILHAIHPDRVILFYNNRYETLRLLGYKQPSEVPQTTATTPNKPTSELNNYRQAIISQPDKILDYVTFQPEYQDNRLLGYRLSQGKEPELFRELGLQNNDILIAINEVYLDSADNLMQVFSQLVQAQQVHLRLQRNGQLTQMSYRFNRP